MDTYDTALGESLELKPGADQALRAAKRGGLSVVVISEGPHDAQQTTIERLGIAPWVDLLVTSGGEGTSKSHDLFGRALARAGCDPAEIVFVGDSLERDVGPASALGITCFYVGVERLPEGSAAVKLGADGPKRAHRADCSALRRIGSISAYDPSCPPKNSDLPP